MGKRYTGTAGADTLWETTRTGDTLVGGAGNDTYHAWAATYWVKGFPEYGIPGHDEPYRTTIFESAGRGYDTVHYHIGLTGITVTGSTELAYIERIVLYNQWAATSPDYVVHFRLTLGGSAQTVVGSSAYETIEGGGGNDTLGGGAGSDRLLGGDGADSLVGGVGDDTLGGGAGADRLVGGKGNDTYLSPAAGDVIVEWAGEGFDTISVTASYTLAAANVEAVALGPGNINATGNAGDNTVYAGTGNNVLTGGSGVDMVSFKLGTSGSGGVVASLATQRATGASGNDTLYGFENIEGTEYRADALAGNAAANRLVGLGGDDTLDGGGGNDTLVGGADSDEYRVDAAGDRIVEEVRSGADRVFSSVTYTLPANVEDLTLTGSAALGGYGNALSNTLAGNAGANLLSGGGSIDMLRGEDGNDTLIGGDSWDQLTGGAGADVFRYVAATNWGEGNLTDIVGDFTSGVDLIDLSPIDARPGTAGDQAFAAGDLAYDLYSGILYADIGGDGDYDFFIQLGDYQHPSTVLVSDLVL